MAVQSLWMQQVDFPARWDRSLFDNLWTTGVLGENALKVTGSGRPDLEISVAAGVAVVRGTEAVNQGKYLVRSDAPDTGIALDPAPMSGQRNDLVVLRVRDTDSGFPFGDDAVIFVVPGTPSGSPVDPVVPSSSIVLARVRVPAGTTTITDALIDDLRTPAQSAHPGLTVPAGTIADTVRTTAPYGWALLDGSTLTNAQTAYPRLWAVVPASFKSGSDIVLPDSRGRVLVGLGSSPFVTIGATGGSETHTLDLTELASHTHVQNSHNHAQDFHSHTIDHGHGVTDPQHGHASRYDTDFGPTTTTLEAGVFIVNRTITTSTSTTGITVNNYTLGMPDPQTVATNNATTATNNSTGGGAAHNNLMPYFVLNRMIRLL